ncbi:hypothetical protein [Labrys neptuniae]
MSFRIHAVAVFLQGALTSAAALVAVSSVLALAIIVLHEALAALL